MVAKTKIKYEGILICPQCGSTHIIPHPEGHKIEHGKPLEAYYATRLCVDCKHVGYFFPEVPKDKLKLIRKEIRRK